MSQGFVAAITIGVGMRQCSETNDRNVVGQAGTRFN